MISPARDADKTVARPVFRFAPSPNGPLHLGHALSALTGYEMAQACGGRFLLRIEDIDLGRTRAEHIEAIYADLAWLGLTWEQPVWRQSTRFAAYREATARLQADGLVYPSFANRSQITAALEDAADPARDPDGVTLLPPQLRELDAHHASSRIARGAPFALRLHMPRALAAASERLGGAPLTFREISPAGVIETRPCRPERWGDCVIVRKEIPASYHLAVVVDDAAQGVTHVTRGQDLLVATDIHRLLQVLLGLPEPIYHHHRLILGPDGQKLSKSAQDRAMAELRASGLDAQTLKLQIGTTHPQGSWREAINISV